MTEESTKKPTWTFCARSDLGVRFVISLTDKELDRFPTFKEMVRDLGSPDDTTSQTNLDEFAIPFDQRDIRGAFTYMGMTHAIRRSTQKWIDGIFTETFDPIEEYHPTDDDLLSYLWRGAGRPDGIMRWLGLEIESYHESTLFENYMRREMYASPVGSTVCAPIPEQFREPYVGLVKLDKELWSSIENRVLRANPNLLWQDSQIDRPMQWTDIQKTLAEFKDLAWSNGRDSIFIAGGFLYHVLFGTTTSDIDLFPIVPRDDSRDSHDEGIYQFRAKRLVEAAASRKISAKCWNHLAVANGYEPNIICWTRDAERANSTLAECGTQHYERTKNALTVIPSQDPRHDYIGRQSVWIQYILRAYHSPSEVLHGFDVDCCGIGYDGENLWVTERCLLALRYGYNTFSYDRMSPSYEWRLAKYGLRGCALYIPGFERSKVNIEAVNEFRRLFMRGVDSPRNAEDRGMANVLDINYHRERCIHDFEKEDKDGRLCEFRHDEPRHSLPEGQQCDCETCSIETCKLCGLVISRQPTKRYLATERHYGRGKITVGSLKGLERLLVLEYHTSLSNNARAMSYPRKNRIKSFSLAVSNIAEEIENDHSDYMPSRVPAQCALSILLYMSESAEDHPEAADKYMPFLPTMEALRVRYGPPSDPEVDIRSLQLGYPHTDLSRLAHRSVWTFINNPFRSGKIWIIRSFNLKDILDIPDALYEPFAAIDRWAITRSVEFKTIRPGEQMTGSFHALVLEDNRIWWSNSDPRWKMYGEHDEHDAH